MPEPGQRASQPCELNHAVLWAAQSPEGAGRSLALPPVCARDLRPSATAHATVVGCSSAGCIARGVYQQKCPAGQVVANYLLGVLELVLAAIISNYKSGTPPAPTLQGGGCARAATGPWELPRPRELKASPSRVPEHQRLSRWAEQLLGQFRLNPRWGGGGEKLLWYLYDMASLNRSHCRKD